MSFDLYVVRTAAPITVGQARKALATASAAYEGLAFVPSGAKAFSDDDDVTVQLWEADRALLSYVQLAADEVDPGAPKMLRLPHLVVSSRSQSAPFVEVAAFELARALGGKVVDPATEKVIKKPASDLSPEALQKLSKRGSRRARDATSFDALRKGAAYAVVARFVPQKGIDPVRAVAAQLKVSRDRSESLVLSARYRLGGDREIGVFAETRFDASGKPHESQVLIEGDGSDEHHRLGEAVAAKLGTLRYGTR